MTADTASRLPETRSVPLAWRNLVANKLRLVRSIAGIGFAVLLMLVQLGFERGFFEASLGMLRELDGDLFIMRASKYRFGSEDPFPAADLAPARAVAGVASVDAALRRLAALSLEGPERREDLSRAGLSGSIPTIPPFSIPELRQQSELLKPLDTVIVDRRSRPFLGMDERRERDRDQRPQGADRRQLCARPRFHGQRHRDDERRAPTPRCWPATRIFCNTSRSSSASSSCSPAADIAAVQKALRAALPGELRVLSKPELEAFERAFQADLSSAGPIFWMGTIVGFVVGMLISYQIIYTDLSDQLPQYATLKGMGYGSRYLVRVVFQQAAFAAVAAYIPAWLLCLARLPHHRRTGADAAAHDA